MQALHFTITINAPVSTVRDTMLNHPTYEQWTTAFATGSTYIGSRDQDTEMRFVEESGQGGMLAKIVHNRLHAYICIQHLGQINEDTTITMFEGESFENYTFTATDTNTTKLDIELTAMPDEWVEMFNQMRPKALDLLKGLCEK